MNTHDMIMFYVHTRELLVDYMLYSSLEARCCDHDASAAKVVPGCF